MASHTSSWAGIASGIPILGLMLSSSLTGCMLEPDAGTAESSQTTGDEVASVDQSGEAELTDEEIAQVGEEFRGFHHFRFCGGMWNSSCGGDELCLPFMPRGCPGPRRIGMCVPRPHHCPDFTYPVCGCDGKTYDNFCEAAQAGVSIEHHGACADSGEPVCGGAAGSCAGASTCADDPGDSCTPGNGRDCPGLCTCDTVDRCPADMHWDSTPTICGCVPNGVDRDPCQSVVCRGNDVCVAHPDGTATCEAP